MNCFTVSLFGHREISGSENIINIVEKLERITKDLLMQKEFVRFLVGRDSGFDILAASVIRKCKLSSCRDNSDLTWVLPYMKAEFRDNPDDFYDFFDNVIVCEKSERVYFKSAIQVRNRDMVDRSDLVIFCVSNKIGGAYRTLRYAEKQKVPYVNLTELDEEFRAYLDVMEKIHSPLR